VSDDISAPPVKRLTILPLDGLGVAELQEFITDLRAEITRVEGMITRKQDHRSAAEMVFGKREGAG